MHRSDERHPEDAYIEDLANGLALLDAASEHLDDELRQKVRGIRRAMEDELSPCPEPALVPPTGGSEVFEAARAITSSVFARTRPR